jgi:hypothetical protein
MGKIMMPITMLPNTPRMQCDAILRLEISQWCIDSPLQLYFTHISSTLSSLMKVLVALWSGGTIYFKICIDFS